MKNGKTLEQIEALIRRYDNIRVEHPKNLFVRDIHEALLELWTIKKAEKANG